MTLAMLAAALLAVPLDARAQGMEPPSTSLPDLDGMPDIGLPWPDLGVGDPVIAPLPDLPPAPVQAEALPPLATPDDPAAQAEEGRAERLAHIDPAQPLRYDMGLKGVDGIADSAFTTRFDALSELRKALHKDANIAQINRRAKADVTLLDRLMRVRGYYDARVGYQLDAPPNDGQRIDVTLTVDAQGLYHLSQVTLTGLSEANAREAAIRRLFTVKAGDPADTDMILAATDQMRAGLAEGGYPFAKVDDPELRVDHDDRDATLDMAVATGGYRQFGQIRVSGKPPFDAAHVAEIARFHPGDPYKKSDLTDLQRALVATGLVGSADIQARPAADPALVDLDVALTRAPARTIAGSLGYGTGTGARAELSWQHRNLLPPEGGVTLRGVLGQDEQSTSIAFRRNNFRARDHAVTAQIGYSYLNEDAYTAKTVTLAAGLERQTNIIFQKKWVWSVGGELILSDERDLYGASLTPRRRIYTIAATPGKLGYDGTNDLLDPTRGFRLSGMLSPELSLQAGAFGYVRAQVDGSAYFPATDRLTIASRFRLGTIVGASADRIAPTRRFYAGGGASVRGYAYQAIGPRDLNNDPVGGRSLGELSIEARFRFGSARQFGIVPFVDAGTISSDPWPSIKEMRVGAGLGVRYYSNFGPIRVDVGTPVNPQPGDPRIGVYVSLGQAF